MSSYNFDQEDEADYLYFFYQDPSAPKCPNCKSHASTQNDKFQSYTMLCDDCGQEYYVVNGESRLL